jgi:hypothetical protein
MKNEVRRKTTLLQKYNDITLHRVEIITQHPGNPEVESRIAYYIVESAVLGVRRIFKRHLSALNFFRQEKRNMDDLP